MNQGMSKYIECVGKVLLSALGWVLQVFAMDFSTFFYEWRQVR